MNKFNSVYSYLEKSSDEVKVRVWNKRCDVLNDDHRIYENTKENLAKVFVSEFLASKAIMKEPNYTAGHKYFMYNAKNRVLWSFNSLDATLFRSTEYLLEYGDAGLELNDLDDWLESQYIKEYFDSTPVEDVKAVIEESEPIDFLMEDWNDISAQMIMDVCVYRSNL